MKKVILDPGHGGPDNVGTTANGLVEKDITLLICQKASRLMAAEGIPHDLIRYDDRALSQWQRAANSRRDSLVISVHVNAYSPNHKANGAECYIWPGYLPGVGEGNGNHVSRAVAQVILDNLPPEMHSRGVIVARQDMDGDGETKDDRWIENPRAILSAHPGPVVLFEVGYATNAHDAKLLKTPKGRDGIARAIVEGTKGWL